MAIKTLMDKSNKNENTVKNNENNMSGDEEPNFSDPEDFVEDISDKGKSSHFYILNSMMLTLK